MSEQTENLLAACGLDCEACGIRRVPFDEDAARGVVEWFHNMGWLEGHEGVETILEKGMYCCGCLADRSLHWAPECWILLCCVDDKGIENCAQCDEFPCERLVEWSGENEGYANALERLRSLHVDA
jgi:hypothetical protein